METSAAKIQEDQRAFCREHLTNYLASPGSSKQLEPLIAALSDGNWGARGAAAEALGRLGDARALQPLRALLADPMLADRNTEVARLAREVLGQLEGSGKKAR